MNNIELTIFSWVFLRAGRFLLVMVFSAAAVFSVTTVLCDMVMVIVGTLVRLQFVRLVIFLRAQHTQ